MTSYELLKMLLVPNISIWQSHITTICVTSIIATTCAYFLMKHITKLQEQANIEKVQVFRATMHQTMHIVGNFLNNMLYFKEKLESLPDDEQALYEEIVHSTGNELKELRDLERDIVEEIKKN